MKKFCLKVANKEFTLNSLNELFVGNNNDTRGSSLGVHFVPSVRSQVQKNLLIFRRTTILNKLIGSEALPVDSSVPLSASTKNPS